MNVGLDGYEGNWVPPTKADKWGNYKVSLSKGRNRVFFLLIDSSAVGKKTAKVSPYVTPSVFIRSIVVKGVAFTQSCSKCRAGTFSTSGATKCIPCQANQYSARASHNCTACHPSTYR